MPSRSPCHRLITISTLTPPNARCRCEPLRSSRSRVDTSSPLGVGLVYVTALSALVLFEHRLEPSVPPATVETPIEIVVEPPAPEKPDSLAPNPDKAARQEFEEPAVDAPHAANQQKTKAEAPGERLAAVPSSNPPNPSPPQQGEPPTEKDVSKPSLEKSAATADPTAATTSEKSEQPAARSGARSANRAAQGRWLSVADIRVGARG